MRLLNSYDDATNRPPAKVCLSRLNKIHEAYCRFLFDAEIMIVLPKKVKLSKYELAAMSRDAGRLATDIRVCLVDRKGDADSSKCCNSVYSSSVSGMRNDLRNSGIALDPLQDAVRRMEHGVTVEELRYVANVLDQMSQEFAKRAK